MSESPSPRSSTELLVTNSSSTDADELPPPAVERQLELEWGAPWTRDESSNEQQDILSACCRQMLKTLASRAPPRLTRMGKRVAQFVQGPHPPVVLHGPSPWLSFPHRSNLGQRVLFENVLVRRTRFLASPVLFLVVIPIYILVISALSRLHSYSIPPEQEIGCTSTFWPAPYDRCGLDGETCVPHSNASFSFRCPSECASVFLHNPRIVGAEEITYEPLIVGGGDKDRTYRGDSWICATALQSGIVSNRWGGCVTVDLVGAFTNYQPRFAKGLNSVGFPSAFPLSFRLSPDSSLSHCQDLRIPALIFNAFATFILFAILRPTPLLLYWSLVCIGFWHVTLFPQPRSTPPDLEFGFATFLPALFVCHAFWEIAIKWVLPPLVKRIPLEGSVLYLGPWWITVLNNMTLDRLPVDRLMLGDITKRAGGLATLVIGFLLGVAAFLHQLSIMRRTGCLVKYLQWYGTGLGVLIVLAFLPGLNLRIHHYIFAIIFIPGTAFPTRLSAILQGFLLGMFLNGVAAWGFDGILQTAASLRRDAPAGTALPSFISFDGASRMIRWSALPDGEMWDGFRLLVDDVERYAGPALNYSVRTLQEGVPHFFRIAFMKAGERAGDWTMPAILWPNGTWIEPAPGSSY